MDSFRLHSPAAARTWRYLTACLATATTLACASDGSDEPRQHTTASAERASDAAVDTKTTAKRDASGSNDESGSKDKDASIAENHDNTDAALPQKDDANPGAAAVMRYDGEWSGKTSQEKPLNFKVLNRFLVHVEMAYKIDGADCAMPEGEAKLSAMLPMRGDAFTLMHSTDALTLELTVSFTSDSSAEGKFTVQKKGDMTDGCKPTSGTWKAAKEKPQT